MNTSKSVLKERHRQRNQRDLQGSSQCSCFKKLKKRYDSIRTQLYHQMGTSETKEEKITFSNGYERSVPITPLSGTPDASLCTAASIPAEHVPPSYIQHAHFGINCYRDGRSLNAMKELVKTPQQKLSIRGGCHAVKAAKVMQVSNDTSSRGDAKLTQIKRDFDLNKVPLDYD